MSKTVAEIREWYRKPAQVRGERPLYWQEWIGTLLAEIERLKARLKLAEDTCNVLRAHNLPPDLEARLED